MRRIIKKIISNILAFVGITFMVAAIVWLLYWCGAWDIQAISQSEAYSMYPLALIPLVIGGIFFYGACKLEEDEEE